jgi:hypothetical protein
MEQDNLTFRDFAGAVMGGDSGKAATVLETLLGLSPEAANSATACFQERMQSQGQAFMMKAMGLRNAVTGGDASATQALLAECFGLDDEASAAAGKALAERYS